MANDLLDPKIDDTDNGPQTNPSKDFAAEEWEKMLDAPNSPADIAAQDQRDAAMRDSTGGENEFGYSPDADRRDLANQESTGSANKAAKPSTGESNALSAAAGDDNLYSEDSGKSKGGKRSLKGFLSNKKTRGGLFGGGIVGLLIGGFMGLPPFQLMHIAQSLQNWHFWDDDQTSNWSTRRIINNLNGNRQFNNLGIAGNRMANHYERKLAKAGITLDFNNPDGSSRASIQKITVDPNTPEGKRLIKSVEAEAPDSIRLRSDGRFDIDTRGRGSTRLARSTISTMVDDSLQLNKVSSALSKRLLKRRSGVNFHPLRNLSRERGENRSDIKRAEREERAKRAKEGDYDPAVRNRGADLGTEPDGEGGERPRGESDIDANSRAEADDLLRQTTDLADAPPSLEKSGLLKRLKGSMFTKAGGAAAAIVGLACAARDIGDEAKQLQHAQTILPMMRLAMDIVAAGAQMQAGENISAESIGSISETFYDIQAEEGAESFFSAAPVQAEMGKEPSGIDIPSSAKPGELGEKPFFFQILDDIPGLGTACGVNNWISDVIGAIPGVSAAQNFISGIASGALNTLTGKGIDEWIGSLVSFIAGDAVNVLATGGELGALASYGGKLASNDGMMAMGGVELSGTETAQWKNYQRETLLAERKHQSLYTRMFDLTNPHSLSAVAVLESPAATSVAALHDSVKKKPTTVLSSIGSSFTKMLVPKSYAATPYDYGFNDYGFSQSILDNDQYADPYCNSARVAGGTCMNNNGQEETYEGNLAEYNERWGDCFGNPVGNDGSLTNNKLENYENIDDCNGDRNNPEFIRYRLYILDRTTAATLSCYEGIDEASCDEIGLVGSGGSSPSQTNTGGMIVGDPYTDTTSVACAPGTTDIGIHDAYVSGNMFKSRMCSVSNLPSIGQADNPGSRYSTPGADGHAIVNSRVSGAWYKLVEDAKAEGINFSVSSSFRSMAHQQSLFGGDTSSVARPGYSSHQAGVALDFNNMRGPGVKRGATCSNRASDSSADYNWLLQNAARYGFKQYAAEAWHWDALNAPSRC